MSNYNPIYRKFIDNKKFISPQKMVRAKFYLIKEYEYVDGTRGRFTETTAPIIYTLFVSKAKDIVHCVKVSNVRPELIKKFFGKFVDEETDELQMKGGAKAFYAKVVSKVPIITNEAYERAMGRLKHVTINKTPEFQDYDEDDSSNSNNTSFEEIGE